MLFSQLFSIFGVLFVRRNAAILLVVSRGSHRVVMISTNFKRLSLQHFSWKVWRIIPHNYISES